MIMLPLVAVNTVSVLLKMTYVLCLWEHNLYELNPSKEKICGFFVNVDCKRKNQHFTSRWSLRIIFYDMCNQSRDTFLSYFFIEWSSLDPFKDML